MNKQKIKGFSILSVLLFIVIIVVAISAWALSGETNTNDSNKNLDVIAMSIINDGYKYKAVLQQYTIGQRTALYDQLDFKPGVADPMNLLDPEKGASWEPINSKALFEGAQFPKGYWAYNRGFFAVPAIGTAYEDPTFIVSGISNNVCKKINLLLHGVDTIPVISVTGSDTTNNVTRTTALSFKLMSMHYFMPAANWQNGCLNRNNTTTDNFYYQVGQIM